MKKQPYIKPTIDIMELNEKDTLLAGSGFYTYEEESDGSSAMSSKRKDYGDDNDCGETQATGWLSHQTYNAWFSLYE